MDDEEMLAQYERAGAFRAFVRAPKVTQAGNVAQFFVPRDSGDADSILALGMSKRLDTEVYVTVHVLKDANGADLRRPPVNGAEAKKPYAVLAQILYVHGFFNAQQVHQEIAQGRQIEGNGQSPWSQELAKHLGYESLGYVPPEMFLDWADEHALTWLVPRDYMREAGVEKGDE